MTKNKKDSKVKLQNEKINMEQEGTPDINIDINQLEKDVHEELVNEVVKEATKDAKATKKRQRFDPLNPEVGYVYSEFEKKYPIADADTFIKNLKDPDALMVTKMGRPSKFRKGLSKIMVEFFTDTHRNRVLKEQVVAGFDIKSIHRNMVGVMPTFVGFSNYVGISEESLRRRARAINDDGTVKYPEFGPTYAKCKEIQKNFIMQATNNGLIKENVGKFMLNAIHGVVEDTKESKDLSQRVDKIQEGIAELPYDKLQESIQDVLIDKK